MKRLLLLMLPIALACSCKKENSQPGIVTITSGSKWGIEIGSTPAAVYEKLQALGSEKEFSYVAIVYRQPYSKPEEIKDLYSFYDAIALLKNTPVIERVLIEFPKDSVKAIWAGGALPEEVAKWPQDLPDAIAIHTNAPANDLYTRLSAIYQTVTDNNYSIILPDKTLKKPFDPDMANYEEWAFSFSEKVKPRLRGVSSVRLYFKEAKLFKIRQEYNEHEVYN